MARKKREIAPQNDLQEVQLGPHDCALILRPEPVSVEVVAPENSSRLSEASFWVHCFATILQEGNAGKGKAMLEDLRSWYMAKLAEAKS